MVKSQVMKSFSLGCNSVGGVAVDKTRDVLLEGDEDLIGRGYP
jgi:hypothetical protein